VSDLPTGTVTFLFTDLEGSTRLWEEHPDAMKGALARHDEILRTAIETGAGHVVKTTGDGTHAVFTTAGEAVGAAVSAQRALAAEEWGSTGPLRVRMGLHSGAAEVRDGDYYGTAPNRGARLMAIGHGGQVLVSSVTAELVGDALPDGVRLVDLGEHRLRDLSKPERVCQITAPELPEDFPPLRSIDVLPTNLPVQLTSFVGRATEEKTIDRLLVDHRIVTLTGVGGVGKTRLAMQVAADVLDRYPDGAWFVELAAVDASRVVAVIAGVLGIDVQSRQTVEASLLEALRSRELLLVLDNCEHIVREVRRVGEMILRESATVALLITSREGLRIAGEQLFSVPSLDDEAAISLFVERARAVDSVFALGDEDAATVASLCERLDGMPLAIELAAARVPMFSLEDLARRVDQRFRFLTGGRGDIERHQTLRAAIDWSYDLLTEEERAVFSRLSVFASGCTLDAGEAVIADDDLPADGVLDLLSSLIDKSLVTVDRTQSHTRYGMLETVRQYAQERLVDSGDAETVRGRHARWYADIARSAGRGLYSADESVWLAVLQSEIDNLQVAVAWAVAADETDIAMRIGGSFPRQGSARTLLGTAYLAEQAMRVRDADQHPLRARVLAEAAWAAMSRGDDSTGWRLLDRSIDAQRNGARYAAAAFVYLLMYQGWRPGGYEEGYRTAHEGLAMAEAAGDIIGANGCRTALAAQAMLTGHDDEALELAQRALADARSLRQPTLEAAALYANGIALAKADPKHAIDLLRQAVDLTRRVENDSEQLAALGLLGALEAHHGDARRSLEAIRDQVNSTSISQYYEMYYVSSNVYIGTQVFNRLDRPALVALCDGHVRQKGFSISDFYHRLHDEATREARARLGDAAFEQHAAEGAAMSSEEFYVMIRREIDDLFDTMPPQ
jgi:predicted ATPase/class 3 adenylate cyclase